MVARLRVNVAKVLGAGDAHSVVFVTGPATAGLEAAFASLLPRGTPVVVPVNGTFGARIAEMAAALELDCRPLEAGFGRPIDLVQLEKAVAALPPDRPAAVGDAIRLVSTGGMLTGLALSCSAAWDYTRAITRGRS